MSTGRPFTHVLCMYYCAHVLSCAEQWQNILACCQPDAQNQDLTHRPGDVQSFIHDIVCASYCCSEMLWTQHFVLLCVSLMSYWDVFSKSPAAAPAAAAAAILRFYLINCGLSVSLSEPFLWPLFDLAFLPSGRQQIVFYTQTFPHKQQLVEKGSFLRKLDILWGLNSQKLVSPEISNHWGLSVTHTGNIYTCC